MAKFIKKPVQIEAVKFIGSNFDEIKKFINEDTVLCKFANGNIGILTLEGESFTAVNLIYLI